MRAVWREHRAGAMERLDLIERAVSALTADELDEQLRVQAQRAAHTLIGSVGTFGFIHACEATRELGSRSPTPAPTRRAQGQCLRSSRSCIASCRTMRSRPEARRAP